MALYSHKGCKNVLRAQYETVILYEAIEFRLKCKPANHTIYGLREKKTICLGRPVLYIESSTSAIYTIIILFFILRIKEEKNLISYIRTPNG